MQQTLDIKDRPSQMPNDFQSPLLAVVDDFLRDEIVTPYFQREYIWGDEKLKGWAVKIMGQRAIGVVVTYQIKGGGTTFLADGLQRLTATSRFMKDPQAYGFSFGPEQAREYIKTFRLPVQHRIYDSHEEALQDFQDLNNGTGLTPLEYFKGELCRTETGRGLWNRLPKMVDSHTLRYQSKGRYSRDTVGIMHRDSLALYFQYVTNYAKRYFWGASERKINRKRTSLESLLNEWSEKTPEKEIEKTIRAFDRYIASLVAIIDKQLVETNQHDKSVNSSVMRYLLHLGIWRKNNHRAVNLYEKFVHALFILQKSRQTITSQFDAILEDSEDVVHISLRSDTLVQLDLLCKVLDVDIVSQPEKKNREPLRPGLHHSHLAPRVNNGEGETISEPGLINISRGAKPITE